jgi:hypothetical protein
MGGTVSEVAPAGASSFPELVGKVPVEPQSWGYESTPIDPTVFTTLVSGRNGSPVVGVFTHPDDGRQELVVTVDANQWGMQGGLLTHGLLRWVTKGVYLGYRRSYLGMHIDDVFLGDARWDAVANVTLPDDGPNPIRMNVNDVARILGWESKNNLRVENVFNGEDADPAADHLTQALLAEKLGFGWINHTFSHLNLDTLSQADIQAQIQQNIDFANLNKLPNFSVGELVTGEHSGLVNPAMPAALAATGIKWVASDASRGLAQTTVGGALTVPRYPTNVYFNAGTRAEQLDEYNYVFFEHCTNTATTTCFGAPATWDQYVGNETTQMMQHVLANDPRPHYFHQSNLAEEGVFYPVLDALLARYRAYERPPLVQLSMKESAAVLQRADAWKATSAAGSVTAYLQGGQVVLTSTAGADVPVTGTTFGDIWGGDRSGWQHISRGQTLTLAPQDPANLTNPALTIQGEAKVGSTLTAPASVVTPSSTYLWVRCTDSGEACGELRTAKSSTYTAVSWDAGSTLRVIVTVTRPDGKKDVFRSDPTPTVAAAPGAVPVVPAVNLAAPAVIGEPQVGVELIAVPGVWVAAPGFAYQWIRCDRGKCTPIDGATGASYVPGPSDVNKKLRVSVQAALGDARSESAQSGMTVAVQGVDEALAAAGLAAAKQTATLAAKTAATEAAAAAAVN